MSFQVTGDMEKGKPMRRTGNLVASAIIACMTTGAVAGGALVLSAGDVMAKSEKAGGKSGHWTLEKDGSEGGT